MADDIQAQIATIIQAGTAIDEEIKAAEAAEKSFHEQAQTLRDQAKELEQKSREQYAIRAMLKQQRAQNVQTLGHAQVISATQQAAAAAQASKAEAAKVLDDIKAQQARLADQEKKMAELIEKSEKALAAAPPKE